MSDYTYGNVSIVPNNFDGSFLDIKIEFLGTSIKNVRGIDKNRKNDEYYVEIIFEEGDRKFKSRDFFSAYSYYIIFPNFRNIS
jgi:hypothetical protein